MACLIRSHRYPQWPINLLSCLIVASGLLQVEFVQAFDEPDEVSRVRYERDGESLALEGRILVEAQDGGLLVETADGRQWLIESDEIKSNEATGASFAPISHEDMESQLKGELGQNFKVHRTTHYVIAYDTTDAFAFYVGSLYERLYRGFHSYWKQRRVPLHEPDFPLVVIIFGDQANYKTYAAADLGGDPGGIVAYYQMLTNRVVLYDITGVEAATQGQRVKNAEQISRLLAQPRAAAMVATIVHEATHQIAYNAGLHQRMAGIPMWLNEGLAMFFETPDLRSRTGWRGIGAVNPLRLPKAKELLLSRSPDSLARLLTDDDRFRDPAEALDAYAESWAMVYFLSKVYREEFAEYLKDLAELGPLIESTTEERLELFQQHFGADIEAFEKKYERFLSRAK